MKRLQVRLFGEMWPALVLLAGLTLTMMLVSAVAVSAEPSGPTAVPGAIEGTLYEPDGATPSGGWIDIHDAEGHPWMGTDANPGNGAFSISNLPPGMYILRAYPPPGSPHAASLPSELEVLSGQATPVTLRLTGVRISGYVRDCDAIPEKRIEGATVVAHRADEWVWDATDASGEFKIGGVETGGEYAVEVFPPAETEYAPMPPTPVVPVATGLVLELCIPPINVTGVVQHPDGYPLPEAWAVVWNDAYWDETRTDQFGEFQFRGLPPGEYLLHAGPPWGPPGAGLIALPPFPIQIAVPDTLVDVGVLTLPRAFKTVTGKVVVVGTGEGVPGAQVSAWRLDGPGFASAPTEANGSFTLSLTGGEWHLAVEPIHPPAEWIWPGPPAWVVFSLDTTPETDTVTLKVIPTNAWVAGRVVCPPGSPPCPPPEDIVVELRNDDIRNDAGLGPNYRFSIPMPDGRYELLVHVEHPEWQGPAPEPVFVGPGQTLDVGDVGLLLKDARITGQVRNETGVGVEGVPVVGWQPEGIGWGWAETDSSGSYEMPVIGGEWFVEPQPLPEQPYVFSGPPSLARVAPGGTMTGVGFRLSDGSARIEGSAVDAGSLQRIWGLDGWAWAERIVPPPGEPHFYSDAPMGDGGFELKVAGGESYWVGVEVPPQAPYVSGSAGPAAVPPAGQVPLAVPLEQKDAAMVGALVIAGTSPPERVHGVWAEVFGEDEAGHWVSVGVDPEAAWYELGAVAGTWHLRAWADPDSGYVTASNPVTVTAQSGKVARHDFEVWPIEATISGQVLAPEGTPLPGVFVYAEGESPFVGHFEARAESDGSGNFELSVPEGGYMVGAALPGAELEARGWLNPAPVDVPSVATGSPATGLALRFRRLDGEIQGKVSFAPGLTISPTHPAYVWGYTDTGEWAETEAPVVAGTATFTYTMPVIAGTVWHVGAVYDDPSSGVFYESQEEDVTVPSTPPVGQATQDLQMGGPWPLPQPIIVSFDGSQMQTIQLLVPPNRYLELSIPPRALVDSGTVTLFIFPTQELPPQPGREIVGPGYEMWAIDEKGQQISHFNKNVLLTFPYPSDADLSAMGISEHLLVPVYYSTLVGRWILAEGYVVDTVKNEIMLQIGHFTTLGLAEMEARGKEVYLPLVLRNR